MRNAAAGAHDVVDADAEAGVSTVDPPALQRVDELNGLGQVRAERLQGEPAFLEGFEDQTEVELLEVAQTAVEQLGRTAGGAGGEVAGFDAGRRAGRG